MREIKYRAWNLNTKKMSPPFGVFGRNKIKGFPNDECIIMQFTGLKDLTGKEIYEGDVVRYKHVRGYGAHYPDEVEAESVDYEEVDEVQQVVEFRDGAFTPRPEFRECEDAYYSYRTWDFLVVGNVHENPELVKK